VVATGAAKSIQYSINSNSGAAVNNNIQVFAALKDDTVVLVPFHIRMLQRT
jgi:hypothetical protein